VDSSTRYDDLATNPALEPVTFPSGDTQTFMNAGNMCMTCHQGRESGASVDAAMPNTVVQSPTDYNSFDFVNRHYYAAAAILFGTDVNAAYEYMSKTYLGQNTFPGHGASLSDCLACHARGIEDHTFEVEIDDCSGCHQGITDFEELGLPFGNPNVDWDGDGSAGSFQDEIDGMQFTLLVAIQDYARFGTPGLPQPSPVAYTPDSYPYWFSDTNDNGVVDPGVEDDFSNRYRDFDTDLLRAAFNYHASQDPCSDIHNYKYTLQTLYDSIDKLDDDMLNGTAPGMRP
jgi:hypothetical protein